MLPENDFRYAFGPVPSRRLGQSLGIDLVPFKTCTYDCVYCQLGRTTDRTVERREYVPLDDVVREAEARLAEQARVDYLTISGSGEPTLFSKLGLLIRELKRMTDIPIAVLTNGSLLWDTEVQNDLLDADLVLPSLDAGNAQFFAMVNRPHQSISFETMVEGLCAFRKRFHGEIWLEVLLLAGLTATEKQVSEIAAWVDGIQPTRVQLNTVARPPVESSARGVPPRAMDHFATLFTVDSEVIEHVSAIHQQEQHSVTRQQVFDLLERRPCTLDDISRGLAMHRNQAVKHLEVLLANGRAISTRQGSKVFFVAQRTVRTGVGTRLVE